MNLRRIIVATAAVLAVSTPAYAASPEGAEEVAVGTVLAAKTQPAVQLTSLTFTGQVVVPTPEINQGPFSQLVQQTTDAVLNGKISNDEQSIAKYLFQRMAADVDRYIIPVAPNRVVDAEIGGMCTGWWVTPDGYMVTGAHCVEMSDQALADTFAQQALSKFAEEDAQTVLKDLQSFEADEEMFKLAQQVYVTFNSIHLKIENLQKSIAVVQSLPGGGVDKTAKPVAAELVSVGESYPGKDFALLKVNGQQNLPTVPLGEDSDVQTGSTLYISGFPGLVTNTPFFSLESKLDPALTEGPYNAKRTTQEGVPYIQTQAPSYHGNSGGPVFSREGKVVGMLIAGTVSEGGEASENESFVLPVSVIKEKLNEKNIKPSAALTSTEYNTALDLFFKRHYSAALPKFREVQALHPNHPYVAKYITDSQQAISSGKDETPQPMTFWLLVGGGVLIAIVGGLTVLMLILKRRRKPAAARPVVQYGVQATPYVPPAPQHQPYALPAADQPLDGATRYVRPQQQFDRYGQPIPQQPPQPAHGPSRPSQEAQVADLERELAELRRQLGNRPPSH
ncbi:S1 family peptidase [Acrocarpospora catenulata]|uniref:S1 family peptidase n=1 Tax=Acrocarpospora catenulata TaxID=2836182 RepID=UPI001BDA4DC2|nr:serine protease [Acrocarpospora catenulata]